MVLLYVAAHPHGSQIAADGGSINAQGVLAQKRGLQQPARGSAQKKGSAKGKTLAVPISKALRGGRGQAGGAGRRGRGGRGSVGGRGQLTEQNWNPASLKITIKNDRVCCICATSVEPLLILLWLQAANVVKLDIEVG